MSNNLVGSFEIDDGEKVWIVYGTTSLVEPKNPSFAKPTYFKDKDENDLFKPDLRGFTIKTHSDGSIVFFEGPVIATKQA